jgi:hypothetical protein
VGFYSLNLDTMFQEQYDSKKIKKLHLSDGIGLCDALQLKGDVEKAEKIATELLDIDNTHIEINLIDYPKLKNYIHQ